MPEGTCATPGCGGVVLCKGLCNACYKRARYVPVQRTTAACERCGKPYARRGEAHRWCSAECRDAEKQALRRARRRAGKTLRCAYCNGPLGRKRSDARYCTPQCSNRGEYLACREEIKARTKAWAQANRDAVKASQRARYGRNPQLAMAKRRAWLAASPQHQEWYREYRKNWRKANRERCREYRHARRARERMHPDSVGVGLRDWLRLVNRYGGRCAYCGETPEVLHMDHVVPIARGGRHAIGNVLPACDSCNHRKAARFLAAWRRDRLALTA